METTMLLIILSLAVYTFGLISGMWILKNFKERQDDLPAPFIVPVPPAAENEEKKDDFDYSRYETQDGKYFTTSRAGGSGNGGKDE